MIKYLAVLGLLLMLAQPVSAMCPCSSNLGYMPVVQEIAVPVVAPCATCHTCLTGAACPVVVSEPCNTCRTCLTGAACPIIEPCNTCNTCNPFIKGVAYPDFHNMYY